MPARQVGLRGPVFDALKNYALQNRGQRADIPKYYFDIILQGVELLRSNRGTFEQKVPLMNALPGKNETLYYDDAPDYELEIVPDLKIITNHTSLKKVTQEAVLAFCLHHNLIRFDGPRIAA